MYKRIIMAYDGTPSGQQALLDIQDLAHWDRPRLTLTTVMPRMDLEVLPMELGHLTHDGFDTLEDRLKNQLRKGVKLLRSMGFDADGELLHGEVIPEITRYATAQQADLIVVGHRHEPNLLRRWWSGSTAKSLVEESHCNVLIVVHT